MRTIIALLLLLIAALLLIVGPFVARGGTPTWFPVTSGTVVSQSGAQAFYFQNTGTSNAYILLTGTALTGTASSSNSNFIVGTYGSANSPGGFFECMQFYKGPICIGFEGSGTGKITIIQP